MCGATYVGITNQKIVLIVFLKTDEAFDQVIFAEKNKELRKYDVLRGEGKWEEYLIGKFPEEADNIRR